MPLTLAQEDIKVFEAEENKVSEAEETWSRPKVPLHAFASDCTAAPGPNPKTAVAAATTPEKDDAERAATPKMDDAERAALRERVAALERQINSVTAAAKATKAEQEAAVKMQSVSRGFFGRRALASKKATAAPAPTKPNLRVRRLPPPPIINDLPALSQARLTPIHFPPAGGGAHGPIDRGAAAQADQAAAGPN